MRKKQKTTYNKEPRDRDYERVFASHERSMALKPEKYLYYWEKQFTEGRDSGEETEVK